MTSFATYPSLRDRVVFISGGASGIAESFVEHFCAQGSKVAFIDIKADEGNALCERIAAAGHPRPLFIECNLLDIPAVQAAIKRVHDTLGTISVLVNSAANDTRHKMEDVTVEYWDERMAINLRHFFFAIQAVAGPMKAAGEGAIINVGSFTYYRGEAGMPGYSAAKAGVYGLTRSMARELGSFGIRVNLLMPGWTMTKRQLDLWMTPEGEREIAEKQCLKDKVYPEDVARMALFLAADDSRMISSQEFIVDGGWV